MGILDRLRQILAVTRGVQYVEVDVPQLVNGFTPEDLYRTQVHLRTVISFRARNVASIGLHVYDRVSDVDRARVTDSPLAVLLREPNPEMTGYDLMVDLVSNLDLYDCAYWLVAPADTRSGWVIRPIPPSWVVSQNQTEVFGVDSYTVQPPHGIRQDVPADSLIVFHGWRPGSPTKGSPTIDALRDVLAEQTEAWRFRMQTWKRGGRVGSYLTRPKDAPAWSKEARNRFAQGWAEFQAGGAKAGSTPVLEDGMELRRVGFSAREEQWLDVSKLSLQLVASAYHVNPAMVGQLDEANFASVREFRTMLYTETLGPLLAQIQDRLNARLVPLVEGLDSKVYVEFNLASKLAGSFEEQAGVLSTSTGAPWMTVNEARARANLPALDGGDALVVPLNVTQGGQASPQDGGDPLPPAPQGAMSGVVEEWRARLDRSAPSKLAAGLPVDWGRWQRELAADLAERAATVTDAIRKEYEC